MSRKEKFNKQLLLEGNDDKHVVWALCERFELQKNFEVIDCQGIENLYEQIPTRFKQSEIETLGIIIDADADLKSRWTSLKSLLVAQGFTVPDDLPASGLILRNEEQKTVGVWIMPNNNLNGMLEDFIAFLVPNGDKLLPIVNATLESIEKRKLNKYTVGHKSKAVIHSWLSWQEDPGTPMGLGITKRYLTTDEETCMQLINWLKELFNH